MNKFDEHLHRKIMHTHTNSSYMKIVEKHLSRARKRRMCQQHTQIQLKTKFK